jgi:hypothetical protein
VRGVGPIDEVHRYPQASVELAAIMDADNVGMPQRRGQVRLAAEALGEVSVGRDFSRQDLDRVPPWQPRVLREVHLAHPTGT